jgi:hypothetical protein
MVAADVTGWSTGQVSAVCKLQKTSSILHSCWQVGYRVRQDYDFSFSIIIDRDARRPLANRMNHCALWLADTSQSHCADGFELGRNSLKNLLPAARFICYMGSTSNHRDPTTPRVIFTYCDAAYVDTVGLARQSMFACRTVLETAKPGSSAHCRSWVACLFAHRRA